MHRDPTSANRTVKRYFTALTDEGNSPVLATVQAHNKREAQTEFRLALGRLVLLSEIEKE